MKHKWIIFIIFFGYSVHYTSCNKISMWLLWRDTLPILLLLKVVSWMLNLLLPNKFWDSKGFLDFLMLSLRVCVSVLFFILFSPTVSINIYKKKVYKFINLSVTPSSPLGLQMYEFNSLYLSVVFQKTVSQSIRTQKCGYVRGAAWWCSG